VRLHRAQARHPREPHRGADLRRSAISWARRTAASSTCSS
jgi:hypothetical protein